MRSVSRFSPISISWIFSSASSFHVFISLSLGFTRPNPRSVNTQEGITNTCPLAKPRDYHLHTFTLLYFCTFVLSHFHSFRKVSQTLVLQPCHGQTMFSKVPTSRSLQTSTSSSATVSVPSRWSNCGRKLLTSRL